jgi:exopolysaccharide biosynthesis protein
MEDFNSKYTGKEVENILDSVGSKQDAITDLESIRLGSSKGAASLQYTEVSEEIDDVETGAQVGKTAFGTFMDNIDVDYAYDSSTGANYTVIRVYKTKLDGTKQYPFVVVPDVNEIKYSTLDFMENFADDNGYLAAINSGLGSPATHKIDGIAVQNGVVVNNVPAVYHAGSMPLTIDANGDLSYAPSSANANELVASGIVSAICGFCPIIVDYNTVSPPTVSNVSHFTQNAQRQIIGQFGNGDYAIITCEGRNFNNSDGWTIAEAQTICKKLGLKFAYNLDGGGSTQTVIGKKQLNIIYENEKGRTLPSFIVFNGRSELGVMPDVPDVQVTLESISATYSGGDVEVGTDLATLTGVVVTATYSDGSTVTVSNYTLSGEIAEGENVITVSYRDKTTTFTIVGITGNISGQLVWVIGTTDSGGTWANTHENHRGALYTTENTGSIVALDIDSNSAVNAFNVPSGLTGKLYLPRIPEGVTKLSWSNSDSNVLVAVWLRDSSGTKIAEVGTSYGMASPINLTKYPTAVYWNCDCKYGQKNAKIYANPDNGDSEAYNRYQVVCNTKFTFS